ncbi:hypothetical protein PIROE2DRAFT_15187 [Piromyces sp. E2]|nr:hypothetical protein PIROE2DRAFT_15187 [Piromyces sp. E2]|eukprot:OUM59300.1 hypothetical protein PIROE2DRAFT_15187 [Piromyces sp. E2]
MKLNLSTTSKTHFHNVFSNSLKNVRGDYLLDNKLSILKQTCDKKEQYRYQTQFPNINNFNVYNNGQKQQQQEQQQQQQYKYQNEEEYQHDPINAIAELIIHYIKSLIFIYFIHDCIFEISSSEGPSMLPTLSASGDYILIDKLSSKKKYRKGKVVIAKPQKLFFPVYEKKRNYKVCKRIVGEPNEIIDVPFIIDDIVDGQVVSYIQPYKVRVNIL